MMEVFEYKKSLKLKKNISCIGYFDGVHKGHQELIGRTVSLAEEKGMEPYLITFDPDPHEVISGKRVKQINSFKKRLKLFERYGIKGVIVIPFDEKMMRMTAYDFCEKILKKLNIDTLCCGFDFSFGYMGKGDVEELRRHGLNVEVVDEVTYYGKKISSSRIKEALAKGNVSLAERMLGHEYKK